MASKTKGSRYTAPKPKYRLREYPDAALSRKAIEVDVINDATVAAARAMIEVMKKNQGIGLAAPQVGLGRRLFVYDTGAPSGRQSGVLINPEVIEVDDLVSMYHEGCLSLPYLYMDISRPVKCLVAGLDLSGAEVEIEASGLLARVFQHEIDHLDGKTMWDAGTPEQRAAEGETALLLRRRRPVHLRHDGTLRVAEDGVI